MALIISGRRMTKTRAEMSKGSEIYILHSFQFGFLGFFTQKWVRSGNFVLTLILRYTKYSLTWENQFHSVKESVV